MKAGRTAARKTTPSRGARFSAGGTSPAPSCAGRWRPAPARRRLFPRRGRRGGKGGSGLRSACGIGFAGRSAWLGWWLRGRLGGLGGGASRGIVFGVWRGMWGWGGGCRGGGLRGGRRLG